MPDRRWYVCTEEDWLSRRRKLSSHSCLWVPIPSLFTTDIPFRYFLSLFFSSSRDWSIDWRSKTMRGDQWFHLSSISNDLFRKMEIVLVDASMQPSQRGTNNHRQEESAAYLVCLFISSGAIIIDIYSHRFIPGHQTVHLFPYFPHSHFLSFLLHFSNNCSSLLSFSWSNLWHGIWYGQSEYLVSFILSSTDCTSTCSNDLDCEGALRCCEVNSCSRRCVQPVRTTSKMNIQWIFIVFSYSRLSQCPQIIRFTEEGRGDSWIEYSPMRSHHWLHSYLFIIVINSFQVNSLLFNALTLIVGVWTLLLVSSSWSSHKNKKKYSQDRRHQGLVFVEWEMQ